MSKIQESGKSDSAIRANVTLELAKNHEEELRNGDEIDPAILELLYNEPKGKQALAPSEIKDPDYVHKWVNADMPGRLEYFLALGATIVQRVDYTGKTYNHTAQKGQIGKMVHIKLPRKISELREKIKKDERKAKQLEANAALKEDRYTVINESSLIER